MKHSFFSKLVLASLLLLGTTRLVAQDLPDIVPPSPNAASLAKFVEVPVSHYTGLPNISIPIYNVSSGDIQVPVSLSYHARGIKVEELASSYGLGWAMSAGGAITRQIRGNPDDSNHGYLGQSHYDGFFGTDSQSESIRQGAVAAEISGLFDRDPDSFMFNFLGYSGKFIYDRDTNDVILQTFDDLEVETYGSNSSTDLSGGIERFVITDAKGIKYYFGESKDGAAIARDEDHSVMNYTYNGILNSSSATPSGKFTSWYLMEIESPLGNKVTFIYGFEPHPSLPYSITYRKGSEFITRPANSYVKESTFSKIWIYQNKIKQIIFETGVVNFDYAIVREDLDNATALSSVEVKNEDNQRAIKYVFDYVYTTATDGYTNVIYDLYNWEPEAKKRLFLNTIKQEGTTNGNYLPPYKFTYNNTLLPNRFSTARDKWGYYNGRNNGNYAIFTDDITQIAGAAIDTTLNQAGMLTKIEYPTGGWSNYEYESNRAIPPSHFQENIAFTQNNPLVHKEVSMEKASEFYDDVDTYSIPFTVGPEMVVSHINGTGTAIVFVELNSALCTDVENTNCPYLVRICHTDGSVYAILHATSTNTSILPGDYILKVISNDPANEDPDDFETSFGVGLTWNESVVGEDDLIYSGGSRIKQITLDDGNNNTVVKSYEYTDASGDSSGKLFALPSYYGYEISTFTGGVTARLLHAMVYKPANTLTYEQGNHGGYSFVTEYYGDENNHQGKTEYEFTTHYDSGEFYKVPYTLPTDNEWMRGKPLEIRSYRKNHTSFDLIKKIKNTYEYGGIENGYPELMEPEILPNDSLPANNRTRNFVRLAAWGTIYNSDFDINNSHNYYFPYYLNAGTFKLQETENISYYNNGDVNNITQYFYNYDDHYQTKYVQNTDSKGKTTYSEIIYPQDKMGTLTPEELKLKNNLHQFVPLEVNNYVGNIYPSGPSPTETLGKQKTNFFEFYSDVILPNSIETAKGGGNLENRLEYLNYTTNGMVREVSKVDGTHIFYVWGYDQQYPIAKIENATLAQVSGYITNIKGKANSDNDRTVDTLNVNGTITYVGKEGELREALADLRNIAGAVVTSYTYDPLIGVTSVTDPKGYTMYYEYDVFNRLKQVKDADGKILSENIYHYKGQQ